MDLGAGTITVAGAYDVAASTAVDGGTTATFTAPITDLGSDLSVSGTINLPGQSFSFATLENGGTINGGGASLTVTGSMTWYDGTITGFGSLDIADGATLSITGYPGGVLTLDGVVLDNAGAATVSLAGGCCGFQLALEDGAGIVNQPTGSFTFPSDFTYATQVVITSDGTATFFENEGSLVQANLTDGSDPMIIQPAFTQTATGTTSVLTGRMTFNGGGSISGSITGARGPRLTFYGPSFTFAADSSISTLGSVDLGAGTITVAGAYDVAASTAVDGGTTATFTAPITDLGSDLSVSGTINLPGQSFSFATLENGGTINGGGASLTVTGSMTWYDGTITGFGSLDIADGATLSITGYPGGVLTLDGVVLDNAGAATVSLAGGCCGFQLALEDGAGIVNQPTGSFTFPSDFTYATQVVITSDGTATFFENEGSLVQANLTDGSDPMIIQPAFTQTATGTTSVLTGSITLQSTATNAGTVSVASGASLGVSTYTQTTGSTVLNGATINGGTLSINGGALTGTGMINATVTNGGQVIPGGTGATGTITTNGNYTQTATGSLDIELGGTAAGSNDQLAVSGAATLGGTVDVALINGFQPALGNTFEPLTFASSTWDFGFYNGIVLGNRLLLDPTLNPTNLTLTVQPAVTTTTLATPTSPSVSGQGVTFTATVTVALPPTTIDPVPTGTVTFYDGSNSIGTGTLSVVGGQDQASLTIATLSTASHQITAVYSSGDANFIPSPTSTAVAQVVNPANTSATVTSAGNPSVFGQSVTFTAAVSVVSPGSTAVAYPTGTVTFYDNGTSIGTGALSVVSGQDVATFTTRAPARRLTRSPQPIPAAIPTSMPAPSRQRSARWSTRTAPRPSRPLRRGLRTSGRPSPSRRRSLPTCRGRARLPGPSISTTPAPAPT